MSLKDKFKEHAHDTPALVVHIVGASVTAGIILAFVIKTYGWF